MNKTTINVRVVLNAEMFLAKMFATKWRGIKFIHDKPPACEPSFQVPNISLLYAILDSSCEIKFIRKTFSLAGNSTLGLRIYLDSILPSIKEDLARDMIISPLIPIQMSDLDIAPLFQSPIFASERLRRCAEILRAIDDDPLGIYCDLHPPRSEIIDRVRTIEDKEREWIDHFKS